MMMIAAGYEDGNDAGRLRRDPIFKMALERLPGDTDLCSQSTISRLENLPDVCACPPSGTLTCGKVRTSSDRLAT